MSHPSYTQLKVKTKRTFSRSKRVSSSSFTSGTLATLGTQDDDEQNKKHNTICVGHHVTQTNTNNVNKT